MSSVRIDTYDRLKNLIIPGELSPGEKLSEDELAKKLSASRIPIREAFRQLLSEGYIKYHKWVIRFCRSLNYIKREG